MTRGVVQVLASLHASVPGLTRISSLSLTPLLMYFFLILMSQESLITQS